MPEISIKAKLQQIADAQTNYEDDLLAVNTDLDANTHCLNTNHYIAAQIHRIEGPHVGRPEFITDSKWRIASALGIFKDELAADGTLTLEQSAWIDGYIAKFKQTPAGHEAIAHSQRQR